MNRPSSESRANALVSGRGQPLETTELRREVESLLAHDSAPVLIDRPMLEAAAAVLSDGKAALAVGQQFGPYRIDRLLGAGGMGRCIARPTPVSIARSRSRCCRRRCRPMHSPARASTAKRRRSRALTHPHICTLHDIGHQDGVDFLVMEYLEGETLAARLEKGPLPARSGA